MLKELNVFQQAKSTAQCAYLNIKQKEKDSRYEYDLYGHWR